MLNLPDTLELAAEISAIDGLPLTDAHAIATEHLRHMPHGSGAGPVCTNCGAYGHTAIDCPEPPLPRPTRVNWSDRERCSYCCGNHPTADCRLRRPVFVGAPGQESGLALIVATLESARHELADLRAAGLHSAASGVCADTLNAVESWLDPEAAAVRAEQLAAQRALVRATLAERVVLDGVAVPF